MKNTMKIQLNTDKTISGNERLEGYLDTLIKGEMHQFSSKIARVEVHLSDENDGKKGADDKRCMLVAWLEHRKPFAITNRGNSVEQAVSGARDILKSSIDGKL
ncbi:MAG: hypothetical protein ACJA2S_005850 [Cyclobacteriaceae bacterium]|jgi:hypothetical protein